MGMMNRRVLLIIFFICIMFLLPDCNKKRKNQFDRIKMDEQTLKDNSSIDVFGIVITTIVENINVDFPAKIEKIHVKEGQRVKLGDLLATLSIDDYKSYINNKEIELEAANYELKSYQLEYQKLQDALEYSMKEFKKEKEYFNNKKTMFEGGNISKKDLDDAESLYKAREKEVNDIKLSLEKYNAKNSVIEIQRKRIESISDELRIYRSKLNMKNLRNNNIVSNVKNGIVYDISYSNGDYIMPSSQTFKKILSIMDIDSMVVQADVPEEFIKDIRIGTEAVISPTADLDRKYNGKVSRISSMAIKKNNETIVLVDISLDNSDDFLMPNFNVDVKILTDLNSMKKD